MNRTLADRNIRAFFLFRMGFSTRFYYPVLAVMFVDYGLTLEPYTLLNVVWAAVIVGLEVPTGALADTWSRSRLVQFAASLMVLEILLLVLAPAATSGWLFPLMILNRMLSGAAEAMASGADEALVYDSLAVEGREGEWSHVLERLGRLQSVAFLVAMLVGGALYDPQVWNTVAGWLGSAKNFTAEFTRRGPALATLGMALVAVAAAMRLVEPPGRTKTSEGTWRQIKEAGRWIAQTPRVWAVILVGLCLDSFIRLFLTFGSTYYRLIELPEFTFGLWGAGFAIISFGLQPVARRLTEQCTARFNFGLTAGLVLVGLSGCALAWRWGGVLFALLLGAAMSFLGFFLSYYLNAWTDSARRATVLSFKGLSFNLAYGTVGLLFAGLLRGLGGAKPTGDLSIFAQALVWLPPAFLLAAGLVILLVRRGQARA